LATMTAEPGEAMKESSSAAEGAGASSEDAWKFDLVRSVGEECQTEAELRRLIEKKPNFVLYDGFEPSGRMHIAQGIFKMINVNKCTKAGGTFIFWVADWFALMNDKMGGDMEKIQTVGKYLIEVWRASGMDMSRVKFMWSSEEISAHAEEYWGQALDVARRSTLARVKKCCQIMGRAEGSLTAAQILYPIMQCTDIFFLKADICQLGVDQRKVNMLARDYCDAAGRKLKPVILSHHMLLGLKKGQAKMSKSDPDSAVFMEDSSEDVERKIGNAYCPRVAEGVATAADSEESMRLVDDDLMNPCLDYAEYVLFSREGYVFEADGQRFETFAALRAAFLAGELDEATLKGRLVAEINALLEPVRAHFRDNAEARGLLEKVTAWRRETLTPTSSLTHLKLPSLAEVGSPLFAVFAPLPSEDVRLSDVWAVLQRLRSAPEGHKRVLWLEDWSSRTLGCVGGDDQCIVGYYELLLHGLRSLAPELMESVLVCWQGKSILEGPNDYWTSVINAGRKCSLEDVRASLCEGESLEGASQVVAALMHVADVLALSGGGVPVSLCGDAAHEGLHALAARYIEGCGMAVPQMQSAVVSALRLQAPGEGLEADTNLCLTDRDLDINRKVKKAFCEPENADFCPPLAWADALLPVTGSFVVQRKEENGGNLSYTDFASMQADFKSGVLHPGDLKPALATAVNAALAGVRDGLKSSSALKQAQKKLEAYAKKSQKK